MTTDTQPSQPHSSPRLYYRVYAALLGLLVLTVLASLLNLGTTWGVLIALTIALAKAILVILYFMHVRESSRTTWLFAAAGFIWLAVLIGLMLVDYLSRGWFTV